MPIFAYAMELDIESKNFGRLFTSQQERDRSSSNSDTTVVLEVSEEAFSEVSPVAAIDSPAISVKPERVRWLVSGYATLADGQVGVWLIHPKTRQKKFEKVRYGAWNKGANEVELWVEGQRVKAKPGDDIFGSSQLDFKRYQIHAD